MYDKSLIHYRKARFLIDKLFFKLLRQKFDPTLQKLVEKHENKPMLIVGNGPSLNRTPLEEFKIPSVGMNKIDLLFKRTAWRPNYIICVNGLVMNQNKKIYRKSDIPIFLDFKAKYLGINGKNVNYFLVNPNLEFIDSYDSGFAAGATVTFSAIQFAYLVRANPIIIVGVDHNFKLNNTKASAIEKRQGEDENHFDPNYFQEGKLWGVPDLVNSELNYNIAKAKCEEVGIQIYDATIGGKLDIFEKISIEKALEMTSS